METLFKFRLDRPAIEQSEPDSSIDLSHTSDYQRALAAAMILTGVSDKRDAYRNASSKFIQSKAYTTSIEDLAIHDKLKLFTAELDALENKRAIRKVEMTNAISKSFGTTPDETLKKKSYTDAVNRLKDSIIAIKHLVEEHHQPIEKLANALRDLEIVRKVAEDKLFPGTGDKLKRYRMRSLKLSSEPNFRSMLITREMAEKKEKERLKEQEEKFKEIQQKINILRKLKKAVSEIMSLDNNNLVSTVQTAHKGYMPPENIRPLSVFSLDIEKMQALGRLQILNTETQIKKGVNIEKSLAEKNLTEATIKETGTKEGRFYFSGTAPFNPSTALENAFRFKRGTERLLSKDTKDILRKRNLNISTIAIDMLVSTIRAEINKLSSELEFLTNGQVTQSIKRVGNALVVMSALKPSSWANISMTDSANVTIYEFLDTRIPHSKGFVISSGIADLIIVKQHLKGYEAMDVARIENILKGERKERDHRRLRQTEKTTFTEIETTTVEEKSLESTERFELSRETSNTIKEEASLKAGLTVSGSYGPSVDFSANAEGSLNRSKERATKAASKFSKDITQRSSEKLTERVLTRVQLKITNEVEEKNNHILDNTTGTKHISGVYQWVEKIYEAQMFNYGMRELFNFMIPEPGAFLMRAMQKEENASVMQIKKPKAFPLSPDNITEENYTFWVHEYAVSGIEPPPEEYLTKSVDYNGGGGGSKTDYFYSGSIEIDEGYKAIFALIGFVWNQWNSSSVMNILIGSRLNRFTKDTSQIWRGTLNYEKGSIPFGFVTNAVSDLAVTVVVKCQRTDRAMQKWKLETHAKLMEAYQIKLKDYEDKLAELELQAGGMGIEIEGENPAINLEIMKDELKKNCISILTNQHYDLFNAVEEGENLLPQINLYQNEAEGPYVRFFEQAFEWEHITWVTYPYFWGRKRFWEERVAFDDPDPLFKQFIKSGYCRAVVPVRLGFEAAVDHFMTFGEIWNGGPLPTVSSPLYLPIADEIAEQLDRPGDEIPVGDPWEVRVPTSLVHLRVDDKLPKWKKDGNDNWVPI